MKIAIHHRKGSFSERWIDYCNQNNINYVLVNAFDNNFIQEVISCDAFLWHFRHGEIKDEILAKHILFALEHSGVKIFPNFKTAWHFDDKVAQKYLLEALQIPLVPSFVFYDKNSAKTWLSKTTFPKVFKLKGGAGSANVKLVNNYNDALSLVKIAFGKGFKQFDGWDYFKDTFKKYLSKTKTTKDLIKSFFRIFMSTNYSIRKGRERDYVYFQDFIPENEFDIRVVVVSGKAFAIKRMNRKNDFRASGSGEIIYDETCFNIETIELALKINVLIQTQCCAMDFIYQDNQPLLVEISYGFSMEGYDKCTGYWDQNLHFHKGNFNPYAWIIKDLLPIN